MAKQKFDVAGVTIKMGAKSQIIETKTGGVIVDFTAHGAKVFNLVEDAARKLVTDEYRKLVTDEYRK